ncbi:MAG: Zn-ribbon domain-containing OB-fold protein [Syntrophomonadaceae bacterium]|nr:Zn-ribbon domain-containing OB-fold protein [Syntrophomonadaceae bacterium]
MSEKKVSIKDLLGLSDEEMRKPLPNPTPWSRPFWEAAKQHRLVLRRCSACGNIDHPPYPYCTACLADEHEWIEAQGKGTLYAYAVNYYGVPFPFWDDMPYVVAMIDLPEGPRMISNIVECDIEKLRNGMELEVVFDDVSDEISLPKWKPV